MPRPSKFTAQVRGVVLGQLELGLSRQTAAHSARIGETTLRRWLDRGKDAPEGSRWHEFYLDVLEAEARAASGKMRLVHDSERPDLAWKWLERREPGLAPPQPNPPAVLPAPITINLALADGALPALMGPALDVIEGEVVDEQDDEPAG
jgi:hypothetical protein